MRQALTVVAIAALAGSALAAEKPAADKPAAEKPAAEKPAAEKPAAEKPAAEKPATDKPAADKPAEKPLSPQAQKLAEVSAGSRDRIPPEIRKIMAEAQAELESANVAGKALKLGDKAPEFELTGFDGSTTTSAELLRSGPLVVVFYRGGWCPYCNVQLGHLEKVYPDIRAAGASLVAISPQTVPNSKATVEKNVLSFPVLADKDNAVAAKFGLVFTLPEPLVGAYKKFGIDLKSANGDDKNQLPLAATFIIDRAGVVRWRFVEADYKKRAEPDEIVRALRSMKTEK